MYVISPMAPSKAMPFYGAFVPVISASLRANGIEVNDYAVVPATSWTIWSKIKRHLILAYRIIIVSLKRPDVVYIHSPAWFSVLLVGLLPSRTKRVINIHGSEIHGRSTAANLFWPIARTLIRQADLVVSPSVAFIEKIVDATGVDESRCFASPSGGFETAKFSYLAKTTDIPTIGYVSRIVKKKGWRLFLAIYDELKVNYPNLRAVIIGDGHERPILEHELLMRADKNIVYYGAQDQTSLREHYASMSVFVFTSEISGVDTLGLVSIEAQACGCPVVATDAAITREYIKPGKNGFLAPLGDVRAFALAIEQVFLWKDDRRRRIADEAQRFNTLAVGAALASAIRSATI